VGARLAVAPPSTLSCSQTFLLETLDAVGFTSHSVYLRPPDPIGGMQEHMLAQDLTSVNCFLEARVADLCRVQPSFQRFCPKDITRNAASPEYNQHYSRTDNIVNGASLRPP
jgi:hypothetical protein